MQRSAKNQVHQYLIVFNIVIEQYFSNLIQRQCRWWLKNLSEFIPGVDVVICNEIQTLHYTSSFWYVWTSRDASENLVRVYHYIFEKSFHNMTRFKLWQQCCGTITGFFFKFQIWHIIHQISLEFCVASEYAS